MQSHFKYLSSRKSANYHVSKRSQTELFLDYRNWTYYKNILLRRVELKPSLLGRIQNFQGGGGRILVVTCYMIFEIIPSLIEVVLVFKIENFIKFNLLREGPGVKISLYSGIYIMQNIMGGGGNGRWGKNKKN